MKRSQNVDSILEKLCEGNRRYLSSREIQAENFSDSLRSELIRDGQTPTVCLITCADSRVVPEYIFQASLGELFVVRVAGNQVSRDAIASVEYAVGQLGVGLVLVLGHTQCGAVQGAFQVGDSPKPRSHLVSLLGDIREKLTEHSQNHLELDLAVKLNAKINAEDLVKSSHLLSQKVELGKLVVMPAIYHTENGTVDYLESDENGRVAI